MFQEHLVSTVNQKVLSLLAKFPDKEFYERQIARRIGIAYGSANRALNQLYSSGAVKRRQEGNMFFYSVDACDPIIIEFKRLLNMLLIEPLVEELKDVSARVVLYGSCAQGADTSSSDLDLFIVSHSTEEVLNAISRFRPPRGFEEIRVQPVVKSPLELLQADVAGQAFMGEVEKGITLWERASIESRI